MTSRTCCRRPPRVLPPQTSPANTTHLLSLTLVRNPSAIYKRNRTISIRWHGNGTNNLPLRGDKNVELCGGKNMSLIDEIFCKRYTFRVIQAEHSGMHTPMVQSSLYHLFSG